MAAAVGRRRAIGILTLLLIGCAPGPRAERNPLEAPPIDSLRVGSVDSVATWGYRRETAADLDGDRRPERIVLAADVVLDSRRRPLWEDGHRWGVFVQSPEGERTLVYGAFVPNGFVECAVLAPDDHGRRRVLVQERTPQQLRALEVEYGGPGRARTQSGAYYQLDHWLPGAGALPETPDLLRSEGTADGT